MSTGDRNDDSEPQSMLDMDRLVVTEALFDDSVPQVDVGQTTSLALMLGVANSGGMVCTIVLVFVVVALTVVVCAKVVVGIELNEELFVFSGSGETVIVSTGKVVLCV